MKHIWSPWRMAYFSQNSTGCIFCNVQEIPDGVDNLIVYRDQRAFIILNRFPYTSGHIMVVANDHLASIEQLDKDTRIEMMELTNTCIKILRKLYHPEGFNFGANIGESAGAGVAEHVHIHIVPRWTGDTSFMSTLSSTRVIPEDLEDTYRRIKHAWLEFNKN